MTDAPSLRSIKAQIAEGRLAEARNSLQQVLARTGDFFLYHELLGDVAEAQGQTAEAQACFRQALALNPKAVWIARKLTGAAPPHPAFTGTYDRYPDRTGGRKAEGGLRTRGLFKTGTPEQPLVTIITAVYDNTTTFQRCIDSVLAQTYPHVEYIVVDGGSPQGTLDILARNDARLDYYVSEPDGGIYEAMNKGLELARGAYICLLNSDDRHDPDFVRRSVETALAAGEQAGEPVDIVYSDFYDGDTYLPAQALNPGILLGNLNVNHCTFLVRKACYDSVGPYPTDLKIVSDMVWLRRAYTTGKRYHLLSEGHFRFSHGGASSGNSPDRRRRIIAENGTCYRRDFPFLSQDEAELLYLLRFGPDRLPGAIEIARRHGHHAGFRAAFAHYIEHCFRDRGAFKLPHTESGGKFLQFVEIADLLGADKRHIRIATSQGDFSEILGRIATLSSKPRRPGSKRILHYVTVFSAPSETFIHDLVTRLEADTIHENFVMYQQPQLRETRPYAKVIEVAWPNFRPEIAREIYRYTVQTLGIDLLIAHFAINEHRLHERIAATGIRLPTIVMTHGVDVFILKDKTPYSAHVLENLALRDDVAFTAVSDYLRRELVAVGVPEGKITVVPNTVNEAFFRHRKTGDFYDGLRPLRLLCIGRLIDWKGHRFLIEALARFRDRCTSNFTLTLVYGKGADELENLRALTARLQLETQVSFVPFVDFRAEPDYLGRFDLYIHPSTYTADAARKSETFGVAVLEAIAAGLPVLTTDAGGLPEVIGGDAPQARIVQHGNAGAIAEALAEIWTSRRAFTDNRAYAEARLAAFSARAQIAALSRLMHQVTGTTVPAALFTSATTQGAGYAAYRVHKGLLNTSIRPTVFTTVRTHQEEPGVEFVAHPSGDGNRWRALQLPPKDGHTIFTVNHTGVRSEDLIRMVEGHDVIAIHWHARFLSIENIASLTHLGKPVVMTIRDMHPLTGGCHFFHGCDKWQTDCAACPQIQTAYTDYPAKVLAAKQQNYDFSNLTIVTISNHTRGIVQRSPHFRDCRLETIPNSIETDVFRPHDKAQVRREFGLPQDRQIIGYVPSYSSEVKGYHEILAAFSRLQGTLPGRDPFVMLVGGDTPATQQIGFDKKTLGYISDSQKLSRAYAAADLVVVPSLEETFSNTAAEAVSCGVPVVGFKTGAIPDLAVDGVTGYTYPIGDVAGLAEGIRRVLTGPDMGPACRSHAVRMLAFMTQARRYETLFHELVACNLRGGADRPARIFNLFEEPGFDQIAIAAETLTRRPAP